MPRVSIITPTFNRADVLARALDSVQTQTHTDAEHIVIDDASTDDTPALLNGYDDAAIPVRTDRFDTNRGANAARNRGLELARGQFVTFLDSDDAYRPERNAILVDAIDGTDYVGVTHRSIIVDTGGHERSSRMATGDIDRADIRRGNPIETLSSTLFRRRVVERAGGFDPAMPASQDYDLYVRILDHGRVLGLPNHLAWYYRRDDAISADPARREAARKRLREKYGDALSDHVWARQAYMIGHQYANAGDCRRARQEFVRAARQGYGLLALSHAVATMLGHRPFDAAMAVKRRLAAAIGSPAY